MFLLEWIRCRPDRELRRSQNEQAPTTVFRSHFSKGEAYLYESFIFDRRIRNSTISIHVRFLRRYNEQRIKYQNLPIVSGGDLLSKSIFLPYKEPTVLLEKRGSRRERVLTVRRGKNKPSATGHPNAHGQSSLRLLHLHWWRGRFGD